MAKQNKSVLPPSKRTIQARAVGGSGSNTGIVIALVTLITLGLSFIGLAVAAPYLDNTAPTEMVAVAQANNDIITTNRSYTGQVIITISGTASPAPNYTSDAFYLFIQNGQVLENPILEPYNFELDGLPPLFAMMMRDNPPPYNPNHVYTLCYHVGSDMRPLTFRVAERFATDTEQNISFTVEGDIRNMGNRSYHGCSS